MPITSKLLTKGELRDSHAECPSGASVFDAGQDDDGDGVLSEVEIDSSVVVCVGGDACTVESKTEEVVVTCKNHAPVQVAVAPGSLVVVADADDCDGIEVEVGLDDGSGGGISGDGVLQEGEVDGTTKACLGTCGDGHIDANEECDDGGDADGDLCDHACRAEPNCLPPSPDPECPAVTYFVDHIELPVDRPASGGFTVALHGVFPPNASTTNTVIDVASPVSVSASVVTFTAPPGAGVQALSLTISGAEILALDKHIGSNGLFIVSYDAPLTYAYNRPQITSVDGCDPTGNSFETRGCQRGGGQILTINGSSFGAADANVRIGSAACEPITIVGDQITCPIPPGFNDASVTLTIRGLTAENAASLEYLRPNITAVTGDAVAGQPITVVGDFAGAAALDVTYGGDGKRFVCSNATTTPGQVVCEAGDHVGAELKFVVKDQSNPSESRPFQSTLSYPAPQLTPFSLHHEGSPANMALTISGAQSERVYFSATGVGSDPRYVRVTYGDYACTHIELDLSSDPRGVSCETTPGTGYGQISIDVDGRIATAELFLSYGMAPAITSVEGCGPAGCPTEGNVSLTITGERFFAPAYALVGSEVCAGSPTSSTSFFCTLPAGSGAANVRVFSQGEPSNLAPVQYAAPSILTISGCSFGSTGCAASVPITIHGNDFGASNAHVMVGDSPCGDVAHVAPHRELTCVLPAGSGPNKAVRIFNGRFSEPFYISYE